MHAHLTSSAALQRDSNFAGAQLRVEYVDISILTEAERSLRKRSDRKLKELARSLLDFGFVVPLLVDGNFNIVAGHGRLAAARMIGMTVVPVIRVEHLTPAQLRLLAIADNRLPQGVEWDKEALLLEFKELAIEAPELDLTASGWTTPEIDILYGSDRASFFSDADEMPDTRLQLVAINRPDDRWTLGRHALGCGDARDRVLLAKLMQGRRGQILLEDPPWNLKIEGLVSGKGKHKHGDFVMAAGEMSKAEFVAFLTEVYSAALPVLTDGALLYVYMDWRNLDALSSAIAANGLEQKNLLVWAKESPRLGSMYRSQHELIGLYKHGDAPHVNSNEMGRYGRNRSNVLFYPGVSGFSKGKSKTLDVHPTSKTVGMLADIILDATHRDHLVLDRFGGSGSTLIAAEKTGRVAITTELDPLYADAIIRRFEAVTGGAAIHAETGISFADVAAERAASSAQEC